MLCRATQNRWVMVESSNKMWYTGEGNGKPLQPSCLESSMNSTKRQKDMTLKDGVPRLVGAQYATGEQCRNNSREEMEPKQKQHPVVDMTGNGSKVRCCKEQYCIGTWNVRSIQFSSVQFSSVALFCLTICNPMDRSMPDLPVHHQLQEFTQTHSSW